MVVDVQDRLCETSVKDWKYSLKPENEENKSDLSIKNLKSYT